MLIQIQAQYIYDILNLVQNFKIILFTSQYLEFRKICHTTKLNFIIPPLSITKSNPFKANIIM